MWIVKSVKTIEVKNSEKELILLTRTVWVC
jgi:hypothetical protein